MGLVFAFGFVCLQNLLVVQVNKMVVWSRIVVVVMGGLVLMSSVVVVWFYLDVVVHLVFFERLIV